uniref:P-type domain-containing protein n=1 Tax=Anolis carolinensis TaxID=28377 RepID=A0A803TE34_ANOCA
MFCSHFTCAGFSKFTFQYGIFLRTSPLLSILLQIPECKLNPTVTSGQCSVPARSRENCGYPGIGEIECSARQCCFDSNVIDAPWCFNPVPLPEEG